jgi:hypothetical protein
MTGTTSGEGTAYPSGAPEFIPGSWEPMSNVNKRWDNLLEGLGDREVRIVYLVKYFQSVQQQKLYPSFHFGKLK